MNTFADNLKADAALFTNPAEFGEAVLASDDGVATRTINALVVRNPASVMGQGNLTPLLEVYVANDAVQGFAAATLDTGKATLTLARRSGETPRTFNVRWAGDKDIMDTGMLKLELR